MSVKAEETWEKSNSTRSPSLPSSMTERKLYRQSARKVWQRRDSAVPIDEVKAINKALCTAQPPKKWCLAQIKSSSNLSVEIETDPLCSQVARLRLCSNITRLPPPKRTPSQPLPHSPWDSSSQTCLINRQGPPLQNCERVQNRSSKTNREIYSKSRPHLPLWTTTCNSRNKQWITGQVRLWESSNSLLRLTAQWKVRWAWKAHQCAQMDRN